jgi:hypothetical protein
MKTLLVAMVLVAACVAEPDHHSRPRRETLPPYHGIPAQDVL